MKLITTHKLTSLTVAVGMVGSIVGLGVISEANQPLEPIPVASAPIKKEASFTLEQTEVPVQEPVENKVQPSVNPQISQPPEAEESVPLEPTVLTTQQYGEVLLDLSGKNQQCFNSIVNKWPERFTPDVRERNVKALRAYANVCTTGIDSNPNFGAIYLYGRNGEFFDSELAKAQW